MPFQGGIYYPYSRDSQGTHSSAGIPSLLNSPLSQQSVNGHCAPGMTPSSGVSTAPPFRFRLRRESVDWRRINAVDIDSVVSQIDVDALQEHINTVTFCSLDGECCPRCHSPVDPTLIKLLRLSQLSVEWLLHCQEFLMLNLHAMEERLEAAGKEREHLLAQQKKQEEKMKMLNGELKQRKKVIRTQQTMLAPGILNSHKCLHCEKAFLNAMYLQNHMQRRHPEEYDNQLRSDSEKKSEIDGLKSEITVLKEQIVQQQQALQSKMAQEKEQESLHRDLLRELDRFKAEEMARMDRKIEDSRDGIRREMEFFYTRNIQALNEGNQQQLTREKPPSPSEVQPERDLDNYKEMQKQAMHNLKQLRKKDKRLQDIQAQHEAEKNQLLNELNKMQMLAAEQQEHSQKVKHDFGIKLHEKEQTIKAQREQIKMITSAPPAKAVESQVLLTASAPEPKPKRVVLESSSLSEMRPVEKKTEPAPAPEKKQRTAINALKKNPNIKREMRPELEKSVTKKLESLGVKHEQTALNSRELESILTRVHSERQCVARELPDYWVYREEINSAVEEKLGGQRRREPDPKNRQVMQIRPRSSSLPSRAAQVTAAERQPKTPLPAPRSRAQPQPKTSTPNNKVPQRSFSSNSDEESEEDTDTEELKMDQRRTPNLLQNKAGKTTPVLTQRALVSSTNGLESRGFTSGVSKTAVTKVDGEEVDSWSDISELQEIDPKALQGFKDQNGNVEKKSVGKENKITYMAKKMEKQFADRLGKKPAGGISILPERKAEIQELTYTDLEESSSWVVSSLEEKQEIPKPAQSSGPMRKSLDSTSTSVWGTSTGKGPKSGATDAGTGSTLKSSLYSLSDISDSEDSSKNE